MRQVKVFDTEEEVSESEDEHETACRLEAVDHEENFEEDEELLGLSTKLVIAIPTPNVEQSYNHQMYMSICIYVYMYVYVCKCKCIHLYKILYIYI